MTDSRSALMMSPVLALTKLPPPLPRRVSSKPRPRSSASAARRVRVETPILAASSFSLGLPARNEDISHFKYHWLIVQSMDVPSSRKWPRPRDILSRYTHGQHLHGLVIRGYRRLAAMPTQQKPFSFQADGFEDFTFGRLPDLMPLVGDNWTRLLTCQ